MIKINLLPVRAAKKKETFLNEIYVGILVLVLTFAGVGWRAYTMKATIATKQKEIVDRKKELENLKETVKKVEEFEAKKQVLQQKIKLIDDLEQGRERFIQIIDQISQAIPGGVWVNNLSFKKGSAKGVAGITIKGAAYEKEDLGIFISNLNARREFIRDVQLGSISTSGRGPATSATIYIYDLSISPQVDAKAAAPEPETKKGKKK